MASKQKKDLPKITDSPIALSAQYKELLEGIKNRIQNAQTRAAITVNQELVLLYYDVGRQILQRQDKEGWGTQVIDRLASDLQREFPHLTGFSSRNLKYMRALAASYPDSAIVQPVVAQIPWSHHIQILEGTKDSDERTFYIRKTIEHGWSKRVLAHQIDSNLYKRQGQATTNFAKTLPAAQSSLAQEVFKDPYLLDFLNLGEKAKEREIERGLMNAVEKFLIELGTGFALVARQYNFKVGKKDRYIDLLFYHLKLRCFVVIELKADEFEPEHTGQLNFYLSAVDDLFKQPQDNPSIGIILCKSKDKIEVEYALRDLTKPIGVSTYELKVLDTLPESLKSQLPSVEELEKTISIDDKETH